MLLVEWQVMRYLVESGVDVTGELGDVLLETAAPGILRSKTTKVGSRGNMVTQHDATNQSLGISWHV